MSRLSFSVGLALLLTCLSGGLTFVAAQEPVNHQAGLAIVFGPDEVETTCVTLPEGHVTGLDVLNAAGIDFQTDAGSSVGVGVCKIGETGCEVPLETCFCHCRGIDCAYWNYLRHAAGSPDGQWQYSSQGAAATIVQPGDVEVWAWGDTGVEVPFMAFAEICPAPGPETPTAEAIPTPPSASISAATAPPDGAPPVPVAAATEPAVGAAPGLPPGCTSGLFSLTLLSLTVGMIVVRREHHR